MKTSLLIFAFAATTTLVSAQGPLTTPLAPGSTFKSLGQLEPRQPVPKGPAVPVAGPHFTISQPGSYSLMGNVTVASGHGIVINASDVTLDLNGFTIKSTNGAPAEGTGSGIVLGPGVSGVQIRSGRIRSGTVRTQSTPPGAPAGLATFALAGFHRGIEDNPTTPSRDTQLTGITVNGCGSDGILIAGSGVLHDITSHRNGGSGISLAFGALTHCAAKHNKGNGISGTRIVITGAQCRDNLANGIFSSEGTVSDSVSSGNYECGIKMQVTLGVDGGSVSGATVTANGDWGILAASVTDSNANDNNSRLIAGSGGISARNVSQCVAVGNSRIGISSLSGNVQNSVARTTAAGSAPGSEDGSGFIVHGGTMTNCKAVQNRFGIYGNFSTLTNLSVDQNSGPGIIGNNLALTNAAVYSNGGTGVAASYSTISGVSTIGHTGIGINAPDSSILGCFSKGNGTGIITTRGILGHSNSRGNTTNIVLGTSTKVSTLP